MIVLGIDTSAKTGSVALTEGASLLGEFTVAMERMHSERLMPAIDALLNVSTVRLKDVGLIAVTRGPGPFTGVRVGITTAKTLAYGLGVPAVGVPTLDAIAYAHRHSTRDLCVLLDARKKEVYAARYEPANRPDDGIGLMRLGEQRCVALEEILGDIDHDTLFVGDGVAAYREAIVERLASRAHFGDSESGIARGHAVASLGHARHSSHPSNATDAADLAPLYLRRPEAELRLQAQAHLPQGER